MGVETAIDSVGLFVENGPQQGVSATLAAALVMATATSTQTVNGADQTLTRQTGCVFWVNVVGSVRATTSVKILIQAKNELTGAYIVLTSLSLASIDTTNDGAAFSQQIWVAKGVTATGGIVNVYPNPLPRVYRVQASITVQATSTLGAVRLEVGQSKLL